MRAEALSCTPAMATRSTPPAASSTSAKVTSSKLRPTVTRAGASAGSAPCGNTRTSPTGSAPTASGRESSSSADVFTARQRLDSRRPSGSSPAKKGGTAPAAVTTGTSVSGKVVATAGSRAPYLAIGWARSCLFGAEELARYEGLLENGMIVPVSR